MKPNPETVIDLRSDTVTLPTEEMRKAMYSAELGDDVNGEDPSVNRLEKLSAKLLGKEAALLVPSGTFGNQLALFTHCRRGDETILSETSHIVEHEAGAASVLSATQLRTIAPGPDAWLTWAQIDSRIRKEEDIHVPDTGCIAVENALAWGEVQPLEEMRRIKNGAENYGIPVHCDGARIFNAALFLGIDVKELAACTDSVMFCLSKGLSAPVGSILAGSRDFIEKARNKRKIMGGGMRQAGIIAAPGIVALNSMRERLEEDHRNARSLARLLADYDIINIDEGKVHINMVFCSLRGGDEAAARFVELLKEEGIVTYPPFGSTIRFVTHYGINESHIGKIGEKLRMIVKKLMK